MTRDKSRTAIAQMKVVDNDDGQNRFGEVLTMLQAKNGESRMQTLSNIMNFVEDFVQTQSYTHARGHEAFY